jgi:hypothetical protein
MKYRALAPVLALVAGSSAGALEACSSSNSSPPGAGDAGGDATVTPTPDAGTDAASTADASPDGAAGDTGSPDTGPSADAGADADAGPSCLQVGTATKIGSDTGVFVVTTDGYVISQTSSGWDATPLDGGASAATGLAVPEAGSGVALSERLVWIENGAGTLLQTWGAGVLSTGASFPMGYGLAISSDGKHVAAAALDGSVRYANSDMTGEVLLQPAPDSGSNCTAIVGFAGTSYLVVSSFCQTAEDGGLVPLAATVTTYTIPGLTPDTLVPSAQPYFSTDAAGTKVFAITSAGAASVYPLGGGASTPIDTNVINGFLSPDGSTVVYTTSAGQLKRASTTSPTPTTLVTSGAYDLANALGYWNARALWLPALSSDGSQVFTCSVPYCLTTGTLGFASTTTAGGVTTVVSAAEVAGQDLFYDPFTHDGAFALVRQSPTSVFGAVPLLATPAGGTPRTIASASTRHFAGPSGAIVIYDDDSAGPDKLYVTDLASSCAPVLVASGISGFWLTPARDQIVYGKSGAGIFTVAMP